MTSVPRIGGAAALGVAIATDDGLAVPQAIDLLKRRGCTPRSSSYEEIFASDPLPGAIGVAPQQGLNPAMAHRLLPLVQKGAQSNLPLIIFAGIPIEPSLRSERNIAAGFLTSFGAVVTEDPDVWLEALVLANGWGIPDSPQCAIVAPKGTWLDAQSKCISERWQSTWRTLPKKTDSEVGVVIVESSVDLPHSIGNAFVVPVYSRGELLPNNAAAFVGLSASLQACRLLGELGLRLAQGAIGPAPMESIPVDHARFDKQLQQLETNVGDHETKVLMASFGVPIIRQAVATTPSAATRIAQKAGYPVELKPWGATIANERDGCPVESDLHSASQVRHAYSIVGKKAGLQTGAPVIVRETPATGRELQVRVTEVASLGWMLILQIDGTDAPIARVAPLHAYDAEALAKHVLTTREKENTPNREELAKLLGHLSAMGPLGKRLRVIHAHRIVAASDSEKTVVIDASAIVQPD